MGERNFSWQKAGEYGIGKIQAEYYNGYVIFEYFNKKWALIIIVNICKISVGDEFYMQNNSWELAFI